MKADSLEHNDHREGKVAKYIESQTSRLPSDIFLWSGLGAMAASLALESSGRRRLGQHVAQWAPVFLITGLYNKLVKLEGHDDSNKTRDKN